MADDMIAALANQKLGVPANPPPTTPPPPPAQKDVKAPDTAQETASKENAPTTEGDRSADSAVSFIKLGSGENERVLSSEQIEAMSRRYSDLNHRHQTEYAPLDPAIKLLKGIMDNAKKAGHDLSGEDMAQFLQSQLLAGQKNPTLGNQKDGTPDTQGQPVKKGQGDFNERLKKWEEENAVSAEPFREGFQTIEQLRTENQEIKAMLAQILAASQGLANTSVQAQQTAQVDQVNAMRQTIANNLNQAQQTAGLPDESTEDFWIFAQERGFTPEDFIDMNLANKVVGDFKANRETPEMARLRAIHERRQSFTGTTGSTPSGPGGSAPSPNTDPFLAKGIEQAMQKKNLTGN